MCRTPVTAVLLICATLAALAGPGRARAAEAPAEPEPPVTPFIDSGNTLPDLEARERERRARERAARPPLPPLGAWYGWQLLATDALTLACLVGLNEGYCLIPFLVGPPVIHYAHGRKGLAGLSVGLRLTGIGVGAAIGDVVANCPVREDSWDFCGLGDVMIGAVVGWGVAAIVDAALGFERIAPATPGDGGRPQARGIAPRVSFARGGVSLGLGGAF